MGYPRANAFLREGIVFRDCRLLPQSLKALLEAHRLDPTVETFSNLGQTYAAMGDWRKAEGLYRLAIVLGPFPRDYYFLATALKAQGKVPESVQALRQALKIEPRYAPALGMLKSLEAKGG